MPLDSHSTEQRHAAVSEIRKKVITTQLAIVLSIVWILSICFMATHLKNGWVPHDEGTLGLSAERVLNGELPHRDFDDYTGGLTFVHALAFRELGIDSASMRIVLFVFFVFWVPAVFYVASRFCSAYSAGAITLLAVSWSVPNYPGPLPSWYNLFFATFGAAALLRFLETGTRRWIFVAGLCGGLSLLAKIAGAYFVAGALLFFIFREQTITSEQNCQSPARARFYRAAVAFGLAVFLVLLFKMIYKASGTRGLVFFVLPVFLLVILLLAREFVGIAGQNRERFARLIGMCVPFAVGIVIPLVVFSVPFLLSGSFHDLVNGLIALPTRAVRFAVFSPENTAAIATTIPFILPVVLAHECGRLGRAICGVIVCLYGCAVLIFAAKSSLIYGLGWSSMANAIPVLVLAGTAILWQEQRQEKLSSTRQQQMMLMMCVTALCSLVQFPFSAPVYFFYVAPLAILTATVLFASAAHPPRFALSALVAFYLLFAVLPGTAYEKGLRHTPGAQIELLNISRAGRLLVDSHDAQLYDTMIPLIQSHALQGSFIYAAPDCPEVYFLSGLKSPTRHYFEYAEEPHDYTQRALGALERLNVNVIAINNGPEFSEPLASDLQGALERRYPHSEEVGRFEVRWKQ